MNELLHQEPIKNPVEPKLQKPDLVALDKNGIHIKDSVLWLDSSQAEALNFISKAQPFCKSKFSIPNKQRIIATEETLNLCGLKNSPFNLLSCQYNKPFTLGQLNLELLPSGTILGGSSLAVDFRGKGTMLYAPQVQSFKFETLRQLQYKKVDQLILGAYTPLNSEPQLRKKEKERFLSVVQNWINQKIYPVILCRRHGLAQEVTSWINQLNYPVACHQSIYQVNKIYEQYNVSLGRYTAYNHRQAKFSRNKLLLWPIENARIKKPWSPVTRPILVFEDSLFSPSFLLNQDDVDTFAFHPNMTGQELRQFVQQTKASTVFLTGPYIKTYQDELKDLGLSIRVLSVANQSSLF